MNRDGSLVATWSDGWVWVQRFAPDGTPRKEEFSVTTDRQWNDRDPAIALRPGGNFVIAWMSEERDTEGWGIFGRSFAANGTPRTDDFQINTTTEGDQIEPAIAASRRSPIVIVVWTQRLEDDGRSDIFARVLAPQP